ncbi:unnamed protein product [Caenorhabditis bovis]|uniref:Uncharacterized protein n=1 Tax=Caenorhabditis bovis TaxID=2654633 RepID=A0A8S1EKE1_9PELO|nr:unnamed protein product [Caenorhabditis bovis]
MRNFLILILLQQCAAEMPLACYYKFGEPDVSKIPANLCNFVILIGSVSLTQDGSLLVKSRDEMTKFADLKKLANPPKLLICMLAENPRFSKMARANHPLPQVILNF